jgi:soluble lytic murein transglycosylase
MFLMVVVCFALYGSQVQAGNKIYTKTVDGVLYFTDTPQDGGYTVFRDPKGSRYFSEYCERIRQNNRYFKSDTYNTIIEEASSKHNISGSLIKAMIKVESGFNPNAVSNVGAVGLMQIMPKTMEDMNVSDPYDPYDNIMGGTRYMRYLLTRFNGHLEKALAAYNAGPSAVDKYNGIPPYNETRWYVDRVIHFYRSEFSN